MGGIGSGALADWMEGATDLGDAEEGFAGNPDVDTGIGSGSGGAGGSSPLKRLSSLMLVPSLDERHSSIFLTACGQKSVLVLDSREGGNSTTTVLPVRSTKRLSSTHPNFNGESPASCIAVACQGSGIGKGESELGDGEGIG